MKEWNQHSGLQKPAGNVTSRKERHDMKWEEKTHIKSNLWSVVCGLGLVREIDLIPWAWTPSIFCLQSIFMNPRGFSRIKHINNQCVRGWRSPNRCIQSERPALGAAQTQCIVGGRGQRYEMMPWSSETLLLWGNVCIYRCKSRFL